jgi:hypothetical protein
MEAHIPVLAGSSCLLRETSVTTKPYDPTLKALVEIEPESRPALPGRPTGATEAIDIRRRWRHNYSEEWCP